MNRITITFAGLLVLSLLLFGCGHLDGNNPLGVTGGGANGYGSAGSSLGAGGNGSGQFDSQLYGVWRNDISQGDYTVLMISAGYYETDAYENDILVFTESGTWYVSGNMLYVSSMNGSPAHGQYNVSGDGNTLTTDFDGTITWHRVS